MVQSLVKLRKRESLIRIFIPTGSHEVVPEKNNMRRGLQLEAEREILRAAMPAWVDGLGQVSEQFRNFR